MGSSGSSCNSSTLAISSVFLKAPSVKMASPFSSTSVQRSTGSRAALARRPVILVVKMDVSNSSALRLRKSGVTVLGPQSRSDTVRFPEVLPSVEANRRGAATLRATWMLGLVARARLGGLERASLGRRAAAMAAISRRGGSAHREGVGPAWLCGQKKGIPSDWKRKYRSSLREGTADGGSAERMAAIAWE